MKEPYFDVDKFVRNSKLFLSVFFQVVGFGVVVGTLILLMLHYMVIGGINALPHWFLGMGLITALFGSVLYTAMVVWLRLEELYR